MNVACEDRERIFLDGTAEEWAALELHAAACAACAEELRAWKELSTTAAELRAEEDSPALWTRIEAALREQRSAAAERNFWWRLEFRPHLFHAWQMALVGAMVVVLGVSGGYVYTHRGSVPAEEGSTLLKTRALAEVERTEHEYMTAIDQLAAEAGPQLNQPTALMANYREKLLVLDSAIAELRTQAGVNPSNAHLRYQLLAMYQEKQETLQDILEMKR